ncbi:MAG: hypothetical protein ABIU10_08275 [Sphingomicrobium sp.]
MVETVQGRVEPTTPKRVKWGYGYYPTLVIHTASGPREFAKISAAGKIREMIERGGEGTFYLSKHAGALGVHGVKLTDGTKYYAHFNNLELIFIIGAVAGAGVLLLRMMGVEDAPITPVVVGTILAVAYFLIRNGRLQAKKAFDAV